MRSGPGRTVGAERTRLDIPTYAPEVTGTAPCRSTTDYNRRQVFLGLAKVVETQKPAEIRGLFAIFCIRRPMLYPVELQAQIVF